MQKRKVNKLDNSYSEDYVLHVNHEDEKEIFEYLGFDRKSMLDSDQFENKYSREGWDD